MPYIVWFACAPQQQHWMRQFQAISFNDAITIRLKVSVNSNSHCKNSMHRKQEENKNLNGKKSENYYIKHEDALKKFH